MLIKNSEDRVFTFKAQLCVCMDEDNSCDEHLVGGERKKCSLQLIHIGHPTIFN